MFSTLIAVAHSSKLSRSSAGFPRLTDDRGRYRLYGLPPGEYLVVASLEATERNVGITVNEYETLLMQHDLAEVLKDPLRFARLKAHHLIEDPFAVPGKALSYARYDVVRVLNSLMEAFRVHESVVERLLAKLMALPARRFLRTRKVSFLASDATGDGRAQLVRGRYQSPILVQWGPAVSQARALEVSLVHLS